MLSILTQNYLTRGFWGDESWTALISQLPIKEIIRVTGEDFHPPFYYLLTHFFIKLFGPSEWIRLVSVFFFLLTVVAVYLLVCKLINKKVAIIGSILTLFSPILFTYAFEARSYALLACLSVTSTLVFHYAVTTKTNNTKWWVLYTLLGVISIYTHYYAWFILTSHGVYWLIAERTQLKKVFLAYFAILLAQLPWIPTLLSQVQSVAGNYWIAPMNSKTHWEWFTRISAGDYATKWQSWIAVFVLLLLGLSVVTVVKKHKKLPKNYLFLWIWLVVPVLLPTLLSFYKPVFFYRYLVFSSIPIILICLWGLRETTKALLYFGALVLLLAYVGTSWQIFGQYPHTMREKLENVFANSPTQDFKLVTVLPSFAEVTYYNNSRKDVIVLPVGVVQSSGKALLDALVRADKVELREILPEENYWLLEPGPKATWYTGSEK